MSSLSTFIIFYWLLASKGLLVVGTCNCVSFSQVTQTPFILYKQPLCLTFRKKHQFPRQNLMTPFSCFCRCSDDDNGRNIYINRISWVRNAIVSSLFFLKMHLLYIFGLYIFFHSVKRTGSLISSVCVKEIECARSYDPCSNIALQCHCHSMVINSRTENHNQIFGIIGCT